MFRYGDGVAHTCQPVSAARQAERDGVLRSRRAGGGKNGYPMCRFTVPEASNTTNDMPTPDNSTVDDRYPIGAFVRADRYTEVERAAFIERLVAQPAAMAAAVSGLSADQLNSPYRVGGWTIRQLVHHVADSHVHMYIRVKLALSADEPLINAYDQDAWAQMADVTAVSPLVSLSIMATIHERVVATFRSLSQTDFERGLMHPENGRMTVEQVLAMYAWHGDHHIAHIRAAKAALR